MTTKTYQKDGNSGNKRPVYCKEHFIEKYGREPNILDKVSLLICSNFHHCNNRDGLGWICGGLLRLKSKYREDNNGAEDWICTACGKITTYR